MASQPVLGVGTAKAPWPRQEARSRISGVLDSQEGMGENGVTNGLHARRAATLQSPGQGGTL